MFPASIRRTGVDTAHQNSSWSTSSITLRVDPIFWMRGFLAGLLGLGLQIVFLKSETLPQQYGTAHTLGGAHAISVNGGRL